jgi:hypothetical protein
MFLPIGVVLGPAAAEKRHRHWPTGTDACRQKKAFWRQQSPDFKGITRKGNNEPGAAFEAGKKWASITLGPKYPSFSCTCNDIMASDDVGVFKKCC